MDERLKAIIKAFLPEILWNPIYLCEYSLRSEIRKEIKKAEVVISDKWLDVGCGLRPYECNFPAGCYVGVDVESSGRDDAMKIPDYFYDGRVLPFEAQQFDGVISTQVLEHVPNPRELLAEMYRVIKPGGNLIISLPFAWQEHEEPYDFGRFSSFGITELLKQAGFEIKSITKDTGAIESLAVMLNVYIINNLVLPIRGWGYLLVLLLCFPTQVLALVLQRLLPDQGKLYLNLVIHAQKTRSF